MLLKEDPFLFLHVFNMVVKCLIRVRLWQHCNVVQSVTLISIVEWLCLIPESNRVVLQRGVIIVRTFLWLSNWRFSLFALLLLGARGFRRSGSRRCVFDWTRPDISTFRGLFQQVIGVADLIRTLRLWRSEKRRIWVLLSMLLRTDLLLGISFQG